MSGEKFIHLLQALGYEKTSQIQPQSLDYLFEIDALQPFLEWFCESIGAENVLKDVELEQFAALEASGVGILEADQLDTALQSLAGEQEQMSEEQLRLEISQMTADIKEAHLQKQLLLQQRNKLNVHQAYLSHRLSKLDIEEKKANRNYNLCLEENQAANTLTNTCLDDLSHAVTSIRDVYQASSSRSSSGVAHFLTDLDLDRYQDSERQYTAECQEYSNGLFFQGIRSITNPGASTRFDILEVSNPHELLVRSETDEVNLRERKELARLQAVYPSSELQRINETVKCRSIQASCQEAETVLTSLMNGSFGKDHKQMQQELDNLESRLSSLKHEVITQSEVIIPDLVHQNKPSRAIDTLMSDYSLKIARQDYYTSNQDKVIEKLVCQRSRNEFLRMAYDIESGRHKDTQSLLSALLIRLHNIALSYQTRLQMMSDPAFTVQKHQRSTIDTRDLFMNRLHQILSNDSECKDQQLYISYASLTEAAQNLSQQLSACKAHVDSSSACNKDKLTSLEKSVRSGELILYADADAHGPLLTPRPLLDAITTLTTHVHNLEQNILDMMNELDSIRQKLKNDPLLKVERNLFTFFFNNPGKLVQALEQLSAKVEASQVQ